MSGLVLGGAAAQAYFRINYFLFVLLTTVVCMVLNPSSLIVLGLLATTWFYLFVARQAPITIGGRAFRCAPPVGIAACADHVAARAGPQLRLQRSMLKVAMPPGRILNASPADRDHVATSCTISPIEP